MANDRGCGRTGWRPTGERVRYLAGLVVVALAVPSPARAASVATCGTDEHGNVIVCLGTIATTLPGSSGSSTPGTTIPEADQYVWPVITTRLNAKCRLIRTIVAPGGLNSQNERDGALL